jgi:hypothetical protein
MSGVHGHRVQVPSIVEAMDDPRLFQSWFDGASWDGWRVVLKSAFALPLTDNELATFKTLAGDRMPPRKRVKELWIIAGRRAGKDSIASLIAAYAAAFFAESHRLRPGERPLCVNLATDRDQSKICLDYTRSFFKDQKMLAKLVTQESRDGFALSNNVDVRIVTNSFRAVRGRTVLLAILDECAFYQSETSATPDTETYRALMPGLATLSDSVIVGISSPYRKSGLLYQKFKDHFGADTDDVLVIKAASQMLNPTIDASVIEQALRDDPAAARAEWLGEFRDDIAGFLDVTLVESAVDYGVLCRPPRGDQHKYFSFIDASGGRRDSFTCAIAHTEGEAVVLDCVHEVKPPFNPTTATEEISAPLKSYNLTETVGDRYGAQWIVDAFSKCGIALTHSHRDRSAIYIDCMPLFTSGRLRLIDNRKLVLQFGGLERRTAPGGRDRIDHGVAGHDDLCNAAAGAVTLAARAAAQTPSFPAPIVFFADGSSTDPALDTRQDKPRRPTKTATELFYENGGGGGDGRPSWWGR